MSEANHIKRKKIYDTYSANLALLNNNGLLPARIKYNVGYICPVCLTHFSEEQALNTKAKNFLTFEDVPPIALGGKSDILTCYECNNTCGTTIDNHLVNSMLDWDKHRFVPGTEAWATIEYNGNVVQSKLTVHEDGNMSVINSKKNNKPQTLEEYIQSISSEKPLVNLSFYPSKVDSWRASVALLKIGYLMVFQKFGYAFILDPMYDTIRKQLLNPDEKIYPANFWKQMPFPDIALGTPVILEPDLESIAPVFALHTKEERRFMVLIPFTTRPIKEVLENFNSKIADMGQIRVQMEKYNDDYLRNLDSINMLIDWISKIK